MGINVYGLAGAVVRALAVCGDRDDVPAVLRQGRDPVRGPDAELGGHAAGPGRLPGVDAVVRGRADDQHVPAVGDEAQESDGDARSAATRAEGDRRQHAVLQQDVRAAPQAEHLADSIDGATRLGTAGSVGTRH